MGTNLKGLTAEYVKYAERPQGLEFVLDEIGGQFIEQRGMRGGIGRAKVVGWIDEAAAH